MKTVFKSIEITLDNNETYDIMNKSWTGLTKKLKLYNSNKIDTISVGGVAYNNNYKIYYDGIIFTITHIYFNKQYADKIIIKDTKDNTYKMSDIMNKVLMIGVDKLQEINNNFDNISIHIASDTNYDYLLMW